MILRAATGDDLVRLRRWDDKPRLVASNPEQDWAWDVELGQESDSRERLIAEADGRTVGFAQIINPAREDNCYWGVCGDSLRAIDFWIGGYPDPDQGHGMAVMRGVIERCFADPGVTSLLADPPADCERSQNFYERLGFQFVVQRCFGAENCAVYRLTRDNYQESAATP